MKTVEEKIKEMGLQLPPVPKPGGIYSPVVITGNYLYVSGQAPVQNNGQIIIGKVGKDITLEEGQLAARQVGLTMLSTLKSQIGDLGRIKRLIKTFGMVNCYPDFEQHPQTINGFSQLFIDVFGEKNGKGARSAVGMFLPRNMAVEVECIFELYNSDL